MYVMVFRLLTLAVLCRPSARLLLCAAELVINSCSGNRTDGGMCQVD